MLKLPDMNKFFKFTKDNGVLWLNISLTMNPDTNVSLERFW